MNSPWTVIIFNLAEDCFKHFCTDCVEWNINAIPCCAMSRKDAEQTIISIYSSNTVPPGTMLLAVPVIFDGIVVSMEEPLQ